MIYSIYVVLDILLRLLELAVIVDFISSWIPQIQGNKIVRTIRDFISPVLEPIRRLQDRLIPGLPIDFSPMVALGIIGIFRGMI
ncbi:MULTISPECIES: YggT family protein [Clostridium]|jgi:YggT family protein|uniref:YGGT family n=1 Tax=Clostridium saccharoperbutylacetonicum N1-4(HMT) TaxID=931276 RepID=M1MNV0_9CLOT|nr:MULTISPECIES: YggT family protein [Clostridium]AGF56401.1 YGGT family [Clostridium saccharoperbutylacetonicum N1-4(HMT)]AQR95142.1 YGGT family protein [Clostridium saccharoperbutylacetonicum]NRT62855.1 YggT family protein [Clostridium saccharoperbutylacetonicum]NSB26210.1 YggT family protein [Clostridium saccharoperbutylacetonicum]NSB30989.1 YggT family protein [Clostridium saccharoperbutylacetonicum]